MKRVKKERDLTLPALTSRFIAYVRLVAEQFNGKLVIESTFDELLVLDRLSAIPGLTPWANLSRPPGSGGEVRR